MLAWPMKPSGPLRGPISPILIGVCVAPPLPLPPHAASRKEISRKRSSVARFQGDGVNRSMCFLLMHAQTFVVLDPRPTEQPAFSGWLFLPRQAAANALTQTLYEYLPKIPTQK